jgi:hypothetical protein
MPTKEELLKHLQEMSKGGDPPTQSEMTQNGDWSSTTYQNYFDGWNNALTEAGFSRRTKGVSLTKKELIDEIHRLAEGDVPPTSTEMRKEGKYSLEPYQLQFGKWTDALREAGYNPHSHSTERELLVDLRRESDGMTPPVDEDYQGKYRREGIYFRFKTWWHAVVRAGLKPRVRCPLTPTGFEQFYTASIERTDPLDQLIGLLGLFTGLPEQTICELSSSWIEQRLGNMVVTVPPSHTNSGCEWIFRLPETWTDSDGRERKTKLPGLTEWYFNNRSKKLNKNKASCQRTIHKIARDAGLGDVRGTFEHAQTGKVPCVSFTDLRAAGAVQMGYNGIPSQRINRHLGIEHTGWKADVEDFLLWLYVHEDYEHPEFSPPSVVLDPDTGKPRYS